MPTSDMPRLVTEGQTFLETCGEALLFSADGLTVLC